MSLEKYLSFFTAEFIEKNLKLFYSQLSAKLLSPKTKKLALNVGNHAYFFLPAFRMRI